MSIDEDQLASLRAINPEAKVFTESGTAFVLLPRQPIQVGEDRREMDALLCPGTHSGYTTRLFLDQPIADRSTIKGQAANWTVHNILGRAWHTWSWQNVSASLPLPQMLLAHLHAFR